MSGRPIFKWLRLLCCISTFSLATGSLFLTHAGFGYLRDIFTNLNITLLAFLSAIFYSAALILSPLIFPFTHFLGFGVSSIVGGTILFLSFEKTAEIFYYALRRISYGSVAIFGIQITFVASLWEVISQFKDHRYFGLICGALFSAGAISTCIATVSAMLSMRWDYFKSLYWHGSLILVALLSILFDFLSRRNSNDGSKGSNPYRSVDGCLTKDNIYSVSYRSSNFDAYDEKIDESCDIPETYIPEINVKGVTGEIFPSSFNASKSPLLERFKIVISDNIWKNRQFLALVGLHGICVVGFVITWTFALEKLPLPKNWRYTFMDSPNTIVGCVSLMMSIGFCLGSCLLGIIVSLSWKCGSMSIQKTFHIGNAKKLRYLFLVVCIVNSLATFLFAFLPVYTETDRVDEINIASFFNISTIPILISLFIVSISIGAFVNLFTLQLVHTLDSNYLYAGVGVYLFFMAPFSVIGTTIGGAVLDIFGSCTPAFFLASGLTSLASILSLKFNKDSGESNSEFSSS